MYNFLHSTLFFILKSEGFLFMIFSCIRHGRTEMNAQDLVCGVTDIPLIDLGIQQAKNASEDIFEKIQTAVLWYVRKNTLSTALQPEKPQKRLPYLRLCRISF